MAAQRGRAASARQLLADVLKGRVAVSVLADITSQAQVTRRMLINTAWLSFKMV